MHQQQVLERARAIHEDIRNWRRTIHRYPELSFTETKTAALVNENLQKLGIETQTGVAKTGVVATIKGKEGAPTIGLRADMDALPIQEENETDFNSEYDGIMHACGHDAHTAMLLGAATVLQGLANEGELEPTIRLLFQPSEENTDDEHKSGGCRMVEEGVMEGLDAVFGLHVSPVHETGVMATRSGATMAAVDTFTLKLIGKGGHAAYPHQTVDPIAMAGLVINAVQQVVSRRLRPIDAGVISITTIHTGTAFNVIADDITLTGTLRSFSPEVRVQLREELERAVKIVEALGGSYQLTFEHGYPVTVNDATATQIAIDSLKPMVGDANVVIEDPVMGAEDFSYMAQAVPGCFLFLGVKDPSWTQEYHVHTPTFRMDENALPLGTAALVNCALGWARQ